MPTYVNSPAPENPALPLGLMPAAASSHAHPLASAHPPSVSDSSLSRNNDSPSPFYPKPPLPALMLSAASSSQQDPQSRQQPLDHHPAGPSPAPATAVLPPASLIRLGSSQQQLSSVAAPAPGSQPPDPGPAAAPGHAQAQNIINDNASKDHLPVIVLGALLGVVIAALLAGTTPHCCFSARLM